MALEPAPQVVPAAVIRRRPDAAAAHWRTRAAAVQVTWRPVPSRQAGVGQGRKLVPPPGTIRTREPRRQSRPVRRAASRAAAQGRHFAPGDAAPATEPAARSRRASMHSRWGRRNSSLPRPGHPRRPLRLKFGRLCRAWRQRKPERAEAPSRRQIMTATRSVTTDRPAAPPVPRAGRWSGPRPGKPSASSSPPRQPAGAWAALWTNSDTRRQPLAGAAAVRRSCRPPGDATSSPD
jgi:hypothetical protein